jgi:serine/threonine-protein kinase
MGSPLYMSPEQMQSPRDVDTRSDTWALGVVLYELLTGVAPFTAETAPELVLKIVTSPPPSLADRRPDLPPGVQALVLTCLQKDRTQRYATVAELAAALAEFAPKRARDSVERIAGVLRSSGMAASALALPSSSGMRSAIDTQTLSPLGRTLPGSFGARKALGLLAGLLALATLASFLLFRPTGQPVQVTSGSNAPVASELPPPAPPAPPGPVIAEGVPAPADSPLPATSSPGRSVTAPPRLATPARNQTPAQPAPPASAMNVAPAPASRPPAPATKKRNCDPNFYLDAQGEKRFKPECF